MVLDPEPGWTVGIRTPYLRTHVKKLRASAATRCECGGLLAENDTGTIWCLRCEDEPRNA